MISPTAKNRLTLISFDIYIRSWVLLNIYYHPSDPRNSWLNKGNCLMLTNNATSWQPLQKKLKVLKCIQFMFNCKELSSNEWIKHTDNKKCLALGSNSPTENFCLPPCVTTVDNQDATKHISYRSCQFQSHDILYA